MVKKLKAIIFSLLFLLSFIPMSVNAASEKQPVIDYLEIDYERKTVTVNAHIENHIRVFFSQYASLSVTDQNGVCQHTAEIEPNDDGTISYTYEHNQKNAIDSCTVTLSFMDSPNTSTAYYSISGENPYSVFGDAIVFMKNSPVYFADMVKYETDNVPYISGTNVYIPYTDEIKALENTTAQNDYTTLSQLQEAGYTIYNDGEIFAIGEFDGSVVNSVKSYFGIYVSAESGTDENAGTCLSPVKTIEKALEIYEKSLDKPVIYLFDGEHNQVSSLTLTAKYNNLIIKAYPDASPLIKKTKEIPASAFKAVEAEDSNLFVASENILYADFSEYVGTKNCNLESYNYAVFDNNERAVNSRYPNGEGFMELTAVKAEAPDDSVGSQELTEDVYIDAEKAKSWGELWENTAPDGIIKTYVGVVGYRYQSSRRTIEKIDDTLNILTMSRLYYEPKVTGTCFVENISKELDVPGEYYITPDKSKIFYYPKENFNGLEIAFDNNPVLNISSAKGICFDGISFGKNSGNIVEISECENITISNGEIFGTNETGIDTQKSKNITLDGLCVYDIGANGILINTIKQTDSVYTLTHENNIIRSCDISDFGNTYLMSRGIYMSGCGNTVENCVVHDALGTGVYILGSEQTFANNDVYGVCRKTEDNGLVYMAGMTTSAGNVIKNNIIHDTPYNEFSFTDWYWGIYLDNAASGITIESNYIYNIPFALNANGGTQLEIKNNIFAETKALELQDILSHGKGYHHLILEGGGIYTNLSAMWGDDSKYDTTIWNERYPYLKAMYEDVKEYGQNFNGEVCSLCNVSVGKPENIVMTGNVLAGVSNDTEHGGRGRVKVNGSIHCYSDAEVNGTTYVTSVENNNISQNTYLTADDYKADEETYVNKVNLSASGVLSEKIKNILSAPTVCYPYNNQRLNEGISQLVWTKAKTADKYKVTVSKNADLSNPIVESEVQDTVLSLTDLEDGKYYYRIDSVREAYHFSETATGEVRSFYCGDNKYFEVTSVESEKENTVKVSIKALSSEADSFDIIFAEKESEYKVINASVIPKSNIAEGDTFTEEYTFSDNNSIIEMFIWNEMKPLTSGKIKLK